MKQNATKSDYIVLRVLKNDLGSGLRGRLLNKGVVPAYSHEDAVRRVLAKMIQRKYAVRSRTYLAARVEDGRFVEFEATPPPAPTEWTVERRVL